MNKLYIIDIYTFEIEQGKTGQDNQNLPLPRKEKNGRSFLSSLSTILVFRK